MIERHSLDAAREKLPVPASPLHLCPSCDYNLTGLVSRRCPECGDSFTLSEARHRAIETSEEIRRFVRSTRLDGGRMAFGIALIVASFAVINWVPVSTFVVVRRYVAGLFSLAGAMMLCFILISLAIGGFLRFYFEVRWASVFLAIGLLCACVTVIRFL
ncbi:hypothetical protein B7486_02625 [cyanobacterium TDX16]|nr:hypothetical protein B7486_02625 [cyanobacterium TDX16]